MSCAGQVEVCKRYNSWVGVRSIPKFLTNKDQCAANQACFLIFLDLSVPVGDLSVPEQEETQMQPVAPRRLGSFKLEIGEELASSEDGCMEELASSKDITCPGAWPRSPRHHPARSTQTEF